MRGNPEKKIHPCRMHGKPYGYHKVDQQFFDGYKALFSSPLSTLAPVGTALNYRDGDGNISGDFIISDVFHIVAGMGECRDGDWVNLDGRVMCRTSCVDDPAENPWLELPLLRPEYKPRRGSTRPAVAAVQWATRQAARDKEPRLAELKPHTAPYKLDPLKVRDLHHLAMLLCPSGELSAVYPPPDPEEVIAAERAAGDTQDYDAADAAVPEAAAGGGDDSGSEDEDAANGDRSDSAFKVAERGQFGIHRQCSGNHNLRALQPDFSERRSCSQRQCTQRSVLCSVR